MVLVLVLVMLGVLVRKYPSARKESEDFVVGFPDSTSFVERWYLEDVGCWMCRYSVFPLSNRRVMF